MAIIAADVQKPQSDNPGIDFIEKQLGYMPTSERLAYRKAGGSLTSQYPSVSELASTVSGKGMSMIGLEAVVGLSAVDGQAAIEELNTNIATLEITSLSASEYTNLTGGTPEFVGVTLTGLTANQAVFTDGSKNLVSNAVTGSGSVAMSASPTFTGTVNAAALTLSGNLTTNVATTQIVFSASGVLTGDAAFTFNSTNKNLHLTNAVNSDYQSVMSLNSSAGAAASSSLVLGENVAGELYTLIQYRNSGTSTSGFNVPNSLQIQTRSNSTGGMYLRVLAAAPMYFITGDTLRMSISSAGVVNVSNLTANQAVFTDGSKNLVSNAITGSGNVVMSASPTFTGTINAAALTLSGNLTTNVATTQVAFSVSGVLTGDATFTWNNTNKTLAVSRDVNADYRAINMLNANAGNSNTISFSLGQSLAGETYGLFQYIGSGTAFGGLNAASSLQIQSRTNSVGGIYLRSLAASGSINLAASGSIDLKVTNGGDVGINVSSPEARLHVADSIGSVASGIANTVAIFQNNGAAGTNANVSIVSGNTGNASLTLQEVSGAAKSALLDFDCNTSTFSVSVNATSCFDCTTSEFNVNNSLIANDIVVFAALQTVVSGGSAGTPVSVNSAGTNLLRLQPTVITTGDHYSISDSTLGALIVVLNDGGSVPAILVNVGGYSLAPFTAIMICYVGSSTWRVI